MERLGQQMKPAGARFRGSTQEEVDLLGRSRPGCFLLKHMVGAESSLDIETFWRLLSKQIAKVGKYPELKLVGRILGGSRYQLL